MILSLSTPSNMLDIGEISLDGGLVAGGTLRPGLSGLMDLGTGRKNSAFAGLLAGSMDRSHMQSLL